MYVNSGVIRSVGRGVGISVCSDVVGKVESGYDG